LISCKGTWEGTGRYSDDRCSDNRYSDSRYSDIRWSDSRCSDNRCSDKVRTVASERNQHCGGKVSSKPKGLSCG